MVRPVMLAVMLGVAGLSACGGKESTARAVVAGADAGKVAAVQGTVTATRGPIKRALSAGDAVAGDDVIETGADGRVTIVLDHNQVPFSLGPGRSQEVGKSPAWAAARGSAVAVTSTDRSGAAGRHAEREAAETLASAPAAAAAPTLAPAPAAPMAPPTLEPAAIAAAPPMDDPPARSKASARRSHDDDLPAPANVVAAAVSADLAPPAGGGGAGGGGAGDQGDQQAPDALTTDPLVGSRDRKMIGQASKGEPIGDVVAKPPAPGGPAPRLIASIETVDVKGGLAADIVLRKVRSRGLSLRECAGATPAATQFELTLTIAASGAVGNAKAAGGTADVQTCLNKQLAALVFPAASTPTVARLTLSLVPR